MQKIKFSDLPQGAQNVFKSVANECICFVRPPTHNQGSERYYIKHSGETTVYEFKDGRWQPTRTY
jgi:hypothetical protein